MQKRRANKSHRSAPARARGQGTRPTQHDPSLVRRARAAPASLAPAEVVRLQALGGNSATRALVGRRPSPVGLVQRVPTANTSYFATPGSSWVNKWGAWNADDKKDWAKIVRDFRAVESRLGTLGETPVRDKRQFAIFSAAVAELGTQLQGFDEADVPYSKKQAFLEGLSTLNTRSKDFVGVVNSFARSFASVWDDTVALLARARAVTDEDAVAKLDAIKKSLAKLRSEPGAVYPGNDVYTELLDGPSGLLTPLKESISSAEDEAQRLAEERAAEDEARAAEQAEQARLAKEAEAAEALRQAIEADRLKRGWNADHLAEIAADVANEKDRAAFVAARTYAQYLVIKARATNVAGMTLAEAVEDPETCLGRIEYITRGEGRRLRTWHYAPAGKVEAVHFGTYRAQASDIEKGTDKWKFGFSRKYRIRMAGATTESPWEMHTHWSLWKDGSSLKESVGYTHFTLHPADPKGRTNPVKTDDIAAFIRAATIAGAHGEAGVHASGKAHLGV